MEFKINRREVHCRKRGVRRNVSTGKHTWIEIFCFRELVKCFVNERTTTLYFGVKVSTNT